MLAEHRSFGKRPAGSLREEARGGAPLGGFRKCPLSANSGHSSTSISSRGRQDFYQALPPTISSLGVKPHQQEATEHDAVEDEEQEAYTHHRPMKGERSGVITGVLPGRETVEAAVDRSTHHMP